MRYRLVLSTAPSISQARKLAQVLIQKKLAACVNILPGAESIYRWKGKVEKSKEVLMLIKTSKTKIQPLFTALKKHHSYEVPELISLGILEASPSYLTWLQQNL